MINDTLHHLCDELNAHLKNQFQLTDDCVVVSPIINIDGSPIGATEKKLVITLINIGSNDALRNNPVGYVTSQTPPAASVLLNIVLSANFDAHTYQQGLKLLSAAMLLLQQRPVFHLTPKQDDQKASRFSVEMVSQNTEATSRLWCGLGAGYLTSMVYTIRTIL